MPDHIARLRRQAIACGVALAVLVLAFLVIRTDGSNPRDEATDLVSAGMVAYQEGDYQTARSSYIAALRLDRRNALAHYNLGLIQHVIDANPEGAEALYRKAVALEPDLSRALYNLGVLRSAANDTNAAIGFYRRAIAADDLFAAAHFNLGLLLRQQDPASVEATTAIDRALALEPTLRERLP